MRCAVLWGLFKELETLFQSPDFVKQDTDDFGHVDLEGRDVDCDGCDCLLGWLLELLLVWCGGSYDFVHSKGGYFFVRD